MKITVTQLGRNISSTGKTGTTTYTFVAVPRETGYGAFIRPEQVPDAIITSRAGYSMRADDRRSTTEVEVDLPDGAIVKTVRKDQRRGSRITVQVVRADGMHEVKYVGAQKSGAGWSTVIEIDGQRVAING